MDLMPGYWQVEQNKATQEKTAFITYGGLFDFNSMPFTLCNVPSTFHCLMGSVLKNLNYKIALCYIDNIIVFSLDF